MKKRVPFTTSLNKTLLEKLEVLSIIEDKDVNDIIESATLEYIGVNSDDLCKIDDDPSHRVRFTSSYNSEILDMLRKKTKSDGTNINRLIELYAGTYVAKSVLTDDD